MEKEFEMSDYLGDEILFQMKLISVVYSFLKKKIYLRAAKEVSHDKIKFLGTKNCPRMTMIVMIVGLITRRVLYL